MSAEPLRLLAEQLGLLRVAQQIKQPGTNELLRVTLQYHDRRVPDSVATLARGLSDTCRLQVVYTRFGSDAKPYRYDYSVPIERYRSLLDVFRQNRFDTLAHQEDLPLIGADYCLVERASGAFVHGVVFSPTLAGGHHRELWNALRQDLPEALRQLTEKS